MELSLPEQTLLLKLEADPLWQDARSYLEDKIYEQPVGLSGDEYKIRLEIREEKKGYWDAIKKALEKEGFMEFLNSLGTRTWLLAQAQRSIEEDPGSSGSFYVTIASALEPLLHHVLPSGLIEKAEQLGKEYNQQVLDHDVDT